MYATFRCSALVRELIDKDSLIRLEIDPTSGVRNLKGEIEPEERVRMRSRSPI